MLAQVERPRLIAPHGGRPIVIDEEAIETYRAMNRRGVGRGDRRVAPPKKAAAGGGGIANPAAISGCIQWLRADLGVTIGTGVATWADQSGNGHDLVQATGAKQPTLNASGLNGQKTLSFSAAASQVLAGTTGDLIPANITVWMVWRWTVAGTGFVGVYTHTSTVNWTDGWGFFNGPTGAAGETEFMVTTYNTHDVVATFNNTSWRISTGTYDGANVEMLTDNASNGTSAFAGGITYLACPTVLGAYTAAGTGASNIEVAEIAVYSRVLNSTEKGQLQTYGTGRYGAI